MGSISKTNKQEGDDIKSPAKKHFTTLGMKPNLYISDKTKGIITVLEEEECFITCLIYLL
jgi:hypothetical protein